MTDRLTYALKTDPIVLYVASADHEGDADGLAPSLTLVASAPDGPGLVVSQLRVLLRVGADDRPDTLSTVSPTAKATSADGTAWKVKQNDSGMWTFTPPDGAARFSKEAVTISFRGLVLNRTFGNSPVDIEEWTAPAAHQHASLEAAATGPPTNTTILNVGKFPRDLTFSDLQAYPTSLPQSGTVRLTWDGPQDDNAIYEIRWGGMRQTHVAGSPWTSPPIYGLTTFAVTLTTTRDGQTLTATRTVQVEVETPRIDTFFVTPSGIGPGGDVALTWHTSYADGLSLYDYDSSPRPILELGPHSDPEKPVRFQPKYLRRYTVMAYKDAGTERVTSAPQVLQVPFEQAIIDRFTASPDVLAGTVTEATLSWDVSFATRVELDGRVVDGSSVKVSPAATTTYTLVAHGVDPAQPDTATVTVTAIRPSVGSISGFWYPAGDGSTRVSLAVSSQHVTSFTVLASTLQRRPGGWVVGETEATVTVTPEQGGVTYVELAYPQRSRLASYDLVNISGRYEARGVSSTPVEGSFSFDVQGIQGREGFERLTAEQRRRRMDEAAAENENGAP